MGAVCQCAVTELYPWLQYCFLHLGGAAVSVGAVLALATTTHT